MQKAIVVPCYNEAQRLNVRLFGEFIGPSGISFLFVDDGSTDQTGSVLRDLCDRHLAAHWVKLKVNQGKAEAVRQGMMHAIGKGAEMVGYFDADLATPLEEIVALFRLVEGGGFAVALASRVKMLGCNIQRKPTRHLLGRLFATLASAVLKIPVYDTQCGAKVFRVSAEFEAALRHPFVTRWAFDVELIGRLLAPEKNVKPMPLSSMVEMPLRRWADVGDSKVNFLGSLGMGIDLIRIWWQLQGRERHSEQIVDSGSSERAA